MVFLYSTADMRHNISCLSLGMAMACSLISTKPLPSRITHQCMKGYSHDYMGQVTSRRCGCLVTWFCYQMIAKPGNETAALHDLTHIWNSCLQADLFCLVLYGWFTTLGSLLLTSINFLIPAWISNHMHSKVWDEITPHSQISMAPLLK